MSETPSKPATLHDVARLAQVSYQTVSRVINNHPNVAKETRVRVLQAIHTLDYRPNRAARILITGRSQTLQLISFNLAFFQPIQYIIHEARELGYRLGISALRDPSSREELQALLDDLTTGMVDGFLLFGPEVNLNFEDFNRMCRGIPFVQIGANPGPMIPSVVFDQRHGTRQAIQHLLDLGHRSIAEIWGNLSIYDAKIRHETYLEVMQSNGLTPGPHIGTDFTIPSGFQAACQLIKQDMPFTALVCGNDQVALGVLRALHQHHIRVPEDVSVVGFDDDLNVAYYEPPLTTVRQDYTAQGRQGIQYLVSLIKDPLTLRYQQIIYPELIIRESTARIRSMKMVS